MTDPGNRSTASAASDSVLDRLPHREPFRFVTEVVALEPGVRGTGVWAVTGEEAFFAGHFPGEPLVPGVLVGEALAQMAGLVGLHVEDGGRDGSGGGGRGRLAHIDLRISRAVAPPARIELAAELARSMGALRQFEVSASVGGELVARGTLVLAEVGGREGGDR